MFVSSKRVSAAVLCALLVPMANAQWRYVDLQPSNAIFSGAKGGGNGVAAGYRDYTTDSQANITGGKAIVWSGISSFDVTPSTASAAVIYASNGVVHGGQALFGTNPYGVFWTSNTSWQTLRPPTTGGYQSSLVLGVTSAVQVGFGNVAGVPHALLWADSGTRTVDLTPKSSTASAAYAVNGSVQVGYLLRNAFLDIHACRWANTSGSVSDMNPASFDGSLPLAINGSFAVGSAWHIDPNTGQRVNMAAVRWDVTNNSSTIITPAGFPTAQANGICLGGIVGNAWDGSNVAHAFFINTNTGVQTDLTTVLPVGMYLNSGARGVYMSGTHIEVYGSAAYAASGQSHAMVWIYDPPV